MEVTPYYKALSRYITSLRRKNDCGYKCECKCELFLWKYVKRQFAFYP